MKKNLFTWVAFIAIAIALSMTSCSKEGPSGADGTNGTDANAFCKNCHNLTNWTAVTAQLESSKHGDKEGNLAEEGNNASCAVCHSRQGYMSSLETGLFTAGPYTGDYTLNCDVCHTFHSTLTESEFPDHAVRETGPVVTMFKTSVTIDKGESNLCIRCHQNRPNTGTKIAGTTVDLDTIADAVAVQVTTQRFGGHHGPQGQLFAGVGKGTYEVGTTAYTNSTAHADLTCSSCHIGSTADNTSKTGGHYYKLRNRETGAVNVTKCVTCHAGTTNHDIAGKQTEIKALLLEIETKLISRGILADESATSGANDFGGKNSSGYIQGNNGGNASSSNPRNLTAKEAKALFNYKCVFEDYSYGVHNYPYIKAVLTNAKAIL